MRTPAACFFLVFLATGIASSPLLPTPSPTSPVLALNLNSSESSFLATYLHNHFVGDPSACGKETTPAEAFTCLFKNITFAIPDIHIPNIKDGITLDIDGLKCSHLAVSVLDIPITQPHPKDPTAHDITATIEGGTIHCAAAMKVSHIPILGTKHAAITFDISKLQFSAVVAMTNTNVQHPELPTAVSMTMPQSDPTPSLSVALNLSKGGVLVWLINLLGKSILESLITKEILQSLAQTLPSAVTPLLNSLIHNVSQFVAPYLNPPDPTPLPSGPLPVGVDPIRWDRGLAGEVFGPLSKILADTSEDHVPLLIHFINLVGGLFGWTSGSIHVNIDQTIHIGNDGLSSSTNVTIETLEISGLDSMQTGPHDLYVFDLYFFQ